MAMPFSPGEQVMLGQSFVQCWCLQDFVASYPVLSVLAPTAFAHDGLDRMDRTVGQREGLEGTSLLVNSNCHVRFVQQIVKGQTIVLCMCSCFQGFLIATVASPTSAGVCGLRAWQFEKGLGGGRLIEKLQHTPSCGPEHAIFIGHARPCRVRVAPRLMPSMLLAACHCLLWPSRPKGRGRWIQKASGHQTPSM